MKMARPLALLLVLVLALSACGGKPPAKEEKSAPAEKKTEQTDSTKGMTVATLAQIDAWPIYSGILDGTALKYGLKDLDVKNLKLFKSGMEAVEGIPSKHLHLADVGSLPGLMAALRFDAEIVGVSANEAASNAILARSDSPVFSHPSTVVSGSFGNADDVRGKKIIMTSVSSSHFLLVKWLTALGLTENDVTVIAADQDVALRSFEKGDADFLVLWSPTLYRALDKGYKEVVNGEQIDANTLMVYVAEKTWAKDHSKEIAAFLAMTSEQVEQFQAEGTKMAPQIQKFFQDYSGDKVSDTDAKRDIELHKLYTVKEQLALIESGDAKKWTDDLAKFFVSHGKLKDEELKTLQDKNYNITDKYLKEAEKLLAEQAK